MTTETSLMRASIVNLRHKMAVYIDLPAKTGAHLTTREYGNVVVCLLLDKGQVQDLIAQLAGAYAALEEKTDVGT